jgi:hypothetical protein
VLDSSLLAILTGSGVAGVFCILFITGIVFPRSVVEDLKEENRVLRGQVEAERDRANLATSTAATTRDVLAALRDGLEIGRDRQTEMRRDGKRAGRSDG